MDAAVKLSVPRTPDDPNRSSAMRSGDAGRFSEDGDAALS